MAIVICNDFLDSDVQKLLREYCVNLVIVCSWHNKIDPKFTEKARALSEDNKATTIISNHCCEQESVISLINFPIKQQPEKLTCKRLTGKPCSDICVKQYSFSAI